MFVSRSQTKYIKYNEATRNIEKLNFVTCKYQFFLERGNLRYTQCGRQYYFNSSMFLFFPNIYSLIYIGSLFDTYYKDCVDVFSAIVVALKPLI